MSVYLIRNLSELVTVLKVYEKDHGDIPVRFITNDKKKLECPAEDSITLVGDPIEDPDAKNAYLRVTLQSANVN